MSPLRIEKLSDQYGKEVFEIPINESLTINLVGQRSLILRSNFWGGTVTEIPDTKKGSIQNRYDLNLFTNELVVEGKQRGDREESKYIITGII